MRDSQRSKVYAAQVGLDPAFYSRVVNPVAYCRDVLARHRKIGTLTFAGGSAAGAKWAANVEVRTNWRSTIYSGRAWVGGPIMFSDPHPTVLTALHECAHVLTWGAHDRNFCRVYLALVKAELGRAAWAELRAAFRAKGVKYTRQRRYTPQAMRELRERGRKLAAARRAVA